MFLSAQAHLHPNDDPVSPVARIVIGTVWYPLPLNFSSSHEINVIYPNHDLRHPQLFMPICHTGGCLTEGSPHGDVLWRILLHGPVTIDRRGDYKTACPARPVEFVNGGPIAQHKQTNTEARGVH